MILNRRSKLVSLNTEFLNHAFKRLLLKSFGSTLLGNFIYLNLFHYILNSNIFLSFYFLLLTFSIFLIILKLSDNLVTEWHFDASGGKLIHICVSYEPKLLNFGI